MPRPDRRLLRRAARALLAPALLAAAAPAAAHSFGKLYTLPVPVWMYLYGAAAALVASFLVIGWFVGTPAAAHRNFATRELPAGWNRLAAPMPVLVLRVLGVALLLLCVATGLLGSPNPYANFSMTFFWIVIVLAYTYWVALFGDSYALLNPWKAIADALAGVLQRPLAGRWSYPPGLGDYPALALYLAFIGVELFGRARPASLSWLLVAYAVITLAGVWAWGRDAWFRHGDFFGVFFGIVGRMSVVERVDGRLRLRQPFVGLVREPAADPSRLLFILFMLSSTAYDGIHETLPWGRLFWNHVAPLFHPWVGTDIVQSFPTLKKIYGAYQALALLLSPLVYLAIYAVLLWLARALTRSPRSLRELCLQFAYTLVPIALVYHASHYFTLALTQGPLVLALASDPFGRGWDLFGTAGWFARPLLLDAGVVWHTQVALILGGHIVGVYLSHLVALRVFDTPRAALLSQAPMLVLMVAYTTIGLWILSLPIQSGVVVPT